MREVNVVGGQDARQGVSMGHCDCRHVMRHGLHGSTPSRERVTSRVESVVPAHSGQLVVGIEEGAGDAGEPDRGQTSRGRQQQQRLAPGRLCLLTPGRLRKKHTKAPSIQFLVSGRPPLAFPTPAPRTLSAASPGKTSFFTLRTTHLTLPTVTSLASTLASAPLPHHPLLLSSPIPPNTCSAAAVGCPATVSHSALEHPVSKKSSDLPSPEC